MTVTIAVDLPDDVYLSLIPHADRSGVQVRKLVAAAVTRSVRGENAPRVASAKPRRAATDAEVKRITELHARGWSDRRISVAVERSHVHIGNVRRRLGLAPNFAKIGATLPS